MEKAQLNTRPVLCYLSKKTGMQKYGKRTENGLKKYGKARHGEGPEYGKRVERGEEGVRKNDGKMAARMWKESKVWSFCVP